jgi:hypothetical protein
MPGQNSPNHFMFIQRGQTLSGIAAKYPGVRSQAQIQAKVRELVRINPHIKNPDRIYAGRLLNLGNASGLEVTPFATDLLQMEELFQQDPVLTDQMLDHWESIQVVSQVGAPVPTGLHLVPTPTGLAYKAAKAARATGVEAAKARFGNLVKVSPHVWRTAEGKLMGGIRNQVRYLKQTNGALGLVPNGARAFGQGTKVFVVSPDSSGGFSAFSKTVKTGKSLSKNVLQPAKTALRVIDFGVSGYNVYKDWGTSAQNRTLVMESIKTAVPFFTGAIKLEVAGSVCAVLTVTTGAGGVACFLTVYLATSVAESAGTEVLGDLTYRLGSGIYTKLYESSSPTVIGN